MSWESTLKASVVVYSGTCSKCGEFVRGGDKCPLSLRGAEEQGRQEVALLEVNLLPISLTASTAPMMGLLLWITWR